jgi:ferredoxin-type protein NapH
VAGLAFLSLYAHYHAAKALEDEQFMTGLTGTVLGRIDTQVSKLANPQNFLDANKGNLWSMRLAGVDITDPLAAAEATAASRTIYLPLLVSILIPVVLTLLLGKIFCSWICPAGLLFEITGKLRRLLRFAEIPPAEVSFSHRNKYILLVVGLAMAAFFGAPIFALVYPPAVMSRLVHTWVFGTVATGMLVILGIVITIELFISPRWWCRTMCPGGALYGLLGKYRPLKVVLNKERCSGCRECEPVCEPGLNPVLESTGIECDNCGVCIKHCPDDALQYGISLPGFNRTRQGRGTNNRRAKAVTLTLILFILGNAPAYGHHILGLPHYSYKENYPQAPTLEYPATTGPYDVLLTSYPGRPVPGEPATLAFYIKNRVTGVPYNQPITVRVLQTFTFGRNREVLEPTTVQPFEIPHKLSAHFPTEGEYVVELTMDVEGQTEVIPFLMVAGDPTATASVLIFLGAGLAVFLVTVRAIKIKRDRRLAQGDFEKSPVSPVLKNGSNAERTLKRPNNDSALQRACDVSAGVYAGGGSNREMLQNRSNKALAAGERG